MFCKTLDAALKRRSSTAVHGGGFPQKCAVFHGAGGVVVTDDLYCGRQDGNTGENLATDRGEVGNGNRLPRRGSEKLQSGKKRAQ